MALYRRGPAPADPKKDKRIFHYEILFAGKRIRGTTHTNRQTVAEAFVKQKRLELERALAGLPVEEARQRIATVKDLADAYLERAKITTPKTAVTFSAPSLKNVIRHLGGVMLPNLTQERIVAYMKARQKEGAAGRTINGELGELARAIGHPWRVLWPKVSKLEQARDVGKALTMEQERALIEAAERLARGDVKIAFKRKDGRKHEQTLGPRGVMMPALLRMALLTGMRAEELTAMQWGQVDLEAKTITVGKAKTAAGRGRVIPLGPEALMAIEAHLAWWASKFGEARPELCVFPWGSPQPVDPARPMTTLKHAWETIRTEAKVSCRWHDLRHSFCTKLAEAGVPESTMLALMGHMSRAMLERYSHIRMAAKREAVAGLRVGQKTVKPTTEGESPTKSPTQRKRATIQ